MVVVSETNENKLLSPTFRDGKWLGIEMWLVGRNCYRKNVEIIESLYIILVVVAFALIFVSFLLALTAIKVSLFG